MDNMGTNNNCVYTDISAHNNHGHDSKVCLR